jgi:hypothetical protein
MIEKIEKDQALLKEHVVALEAAVGSGHPAGKQVALHANDLVRLFEKVDRNPARRRHAVKSTQL